MTDNQEMEFDNVQVQDQKEQDIKETNKDKMDMAFELTKMDNKKSYFQEEGYDKRVYENGWFNAFILLFTFIAFYCLIIIVWWGSVVLAVVWSVASMWYNVAMFLFGIALIGLMITSGYKANMKQKRLAFYLTTIMERQQEVEDQQARENQKKEQDLKLQESKRKSRASKEMIE